jgi:hypothetical protein
MDIRPANMFLRDVGSEERESGIDSKCSLSDLNRLICTGELTVKLGDLGKLGNHTSNCMLCY